MTPASIRSRMRIRFQYSGKSTRGRNFTATASPSATAEVARHRRASAAADTTNKSARIGRIAGHDQIRVVAQPLQAAIPEVAVNIVIGARWHPKECDVPHRGQCQPNDNDLSREA